MSKKKVRAVLKLELQAGKATPAPPVGTALGPHGVNIMDFVKQYNEKTAQQPGEVVPAEITIFEDRSFTFVLKTPPTVFLLKKAAGLEKGSPKPNREKVGTITFDQLRSIAEAKAKDLNSFELDRAVKMVEGTARSMGLEVVGKQAQ
jgi:large subunit ribosomal protein L11